MSTSFQIQIESRFFETKVWLRHVAKVLEETRPCANHFVIGRNLMTLFEGELQAQPSQKEVCFKTISFSCWEFEPVTQPFDVVYSNCANIYTVTENNRLYRTLSCRCKIKPENGLHTWIIPPMDLTAEEAEIYILFRKEGARALAAYEIAKNI